MICKCVLTLCLVTGAIGTLGCGGSSAPSFDAGPSAARHPLAGVVRGVNRAERRVTVAHEAIPGFMDAMTMEFVVKEAWALDAAGAGDRLTATLVVDGARSWIEGVSLSKATSGDSTAGDAVGPAPGTPLPDAPLRDQHGRRVVASDFSGRALVLTFIYTHCPLPDFCPLMMRRLDEVASRLRKDGRRDDVQMVAISIDPARDTPEVLDAYGRAHITGEGADPFHRWSLLTGTPDDVAVWARFFALHFEPDGTEITHGLRTAVVDSEGKVVAVFRGNDWTVEQVVTLLTPATGNGQPATGQR